MSVWVKWASWKLRGSDSDDLFQQVFVGDVSVDEDSGDCGGEREELPWFDDSVEDLNFVRVKGGESIADWGSAAGRDVMGSCRLLFGHGGLRRFECCCEGGGAVCFRWGGAFYLFWRDYCEFFVWIADSTFPWGLVAGS